MKIIDWAKTVVCLSLTVFLGFGSYLFWTTIQTEKQIGEQATSVLAHADQTVLTLRSTILQTSTQLFGVQQSVAKTQASLSSVASSLNQTIALLNHPCVPGPCGTIADIGRTLNTARGTMGQIEVAANHEDKNLNTLDQQETLLFQHTDNVVLGLSKTNSDLDDFVTSPNLSKTLNNAQTITANFGTMSTDANNKFHSFLYPPPCHALKCHLAEGFTFVKDASSLAEPIYWVNQLFTGAKP